MKRRSLLALFGLPLMADDIPAISNTPAWETSGRAKNGQCSVCGRMSEDHDRGIMIVSADDDPNKPPAWLNWCERCNGGTFEVLVEKVKA